MDQQQQKGPRTTKNQAENEKTDIDTDKQTRGMYDRDSARRREGAVLYTGTYVARPGARKESDGKDSHSGRKVPHTDVALEEVPPDDALPDGGTELYRGDDSPGKQGGGHGRVHSGG